MRGNYMKQDIENIIDKKHNELFKIDFNLDYNTKLNLQRAILDSLADEVLKVRITEDTSDGYHTFKELYEYRKLYNAGLFNEWAKQGLFNVHKSERHSDGEQCFDGGWFIVVATLPTGDISNHYEMSDWDLFNCEIREKAKEWDGHTQQDVAKRLNDFLLSNLSPNKENKNNGKQ